MQSIVKVLQLRHGPCCLQVAQSVDVDPMPHYAIINTLLFFLLGLHIYW